MKSQSKITTRSGDKSLPANRQQFFSDSGKPISAVRSQDQFTIEEHLQVQREIEERAHCFWFAKGCPLKNALNDWLKAEDEVLTEFVKARTDRHPVPPAPNKKQTLTEATSSFRPATLHDNPAMSKHKSTANLQTRL